MTGNQGSALLTGNVNRPNTVNPLAVKAIQGVFWNYLSYAGSRLIALGSTMVLARLLAPEAFGNVSCVLLVISYLDMVGDFGVSSALIYERQRSAEAANIAFLVSLLTGGLWFFLAVTGASWVATFFKEPSLEPLLQTMAWVFLLSALGNTHDALLRKDLAFKRRLLPDLARATVKAMCSVVLAWLGWGAWSLVWGHLMGAAVSTLVLWSVVPWHPRWRFRLDLARTVMRYGSQIVSSNVLTGVAHHIDYLIVGRVLGSVALGYYTMAYRIPELFITMLVWAVGNVAFPGYAKLQSDRQKLQQAFLASVRYQSLLTVPVGIGLAVLSGILIPLFFGDKWTPSVKVLPALAIAGCLRSLGSHAADVFKAVGRVDLLTKLTLLRAAVLIPTLIWSTQFGIACVAYSQMAVTGGSTLVAAYLASRFLALPIRAFWTAALPALSGSLAMFACLRLLLQLLASWSEVISLAVSIPTGALVYAAVVALISQETLRRARLVISSAFGRTA